MKYQVILHQHIFEPERYFQQCHASTIEFIPNGGLCAAWFGGLHEKASDVAIWFSRNMDGNWSEPVKVADRIDIPCWNPVLFCQKEKLYLFYKVGNEIPVWQTMVKESTDGGLNWSAERELVLHDFGGRGPVKNKCISMQNGTIVAPASVETDTEWNCFADRSANGGKTWERGENVPVCRASLEGLGVIQPSLWEDGQGVLHMLMRSSEGAVMISDSTDGGLTWSMARRTRLPNNNSGLDLTRLADGRLVVVYNPVSGNWAARSPIAFSVSENNGESWSEPQILDHVPCDRNMQQAEFSYPAVISKENDIYITYTWKRRTIAYWHIRLETAMRRDDGARDGD